MSEAEAVIEESPVESGNLVDQLQTDADVSAEASKSAESGETKKDWKWNDDLPGDGDLPEWLKSDKYGSVAEQAKAYTELESKFGGFTGAPEAYEIALPEDLVLPDGVEWKIEDDDPLVMALMPVLKDMNASQDVFNTLIKAYVETEAGQIKTEMDAEQERGTSELASIPEGAKRVGTVSGWAKANLDDESYNSFKDMLVDSASLGMAEKLIALTRNSKLPEDSETFAGAVTQQEIDDAFKEKDENGKNKYATDKGFRAKVQRMMSNYHGTA